MVEQQIRASVEIETKRETERATAFRDVADGLRKDLRALLGTDGYDEHRALIREETRRRAAILVPRGKLELSARDRQGLRQQQQRRLAAFLRKRGVRAQRLTDLDRRLGKRLAKLTAAEPKGKRPGPIPDSKVPRQVLAAKGDPRLDPQPPYATGGLWSSSYRDSDEYTVSGFHFGHDKNSGKVGNVARLEIWDASNSDYASDTLRTLFGFWWKLPKKTKSLNIWVKADLLSGRFWQYMTTEWYGTSHAWFHSENALFSEVMGVVDGQSYQARTAKRVWTAGKLGPKTDAPLSSPPKKLEGTWDSGTLTESGWYLIEHTSLPTPVPPGGDWVWIWVGSESRHQMWVDDENGHGFANFFWRLNAINPVPVT